MSAQNSMPQKKQELVSKPGLTSVKGSSALPGSESFYNLLDSPTTEAQAAMLTRLPTVQAQSAVQEMNQKQGNRHVQQVMAKYQEHKTSAPTKAPVTPAVQTKLTVSEPGDPLELEADQMAERMLNMAPPAPPPDESGQKTQVKSSSAEAFNQGASRAELQAKGADGGMVAPQVEDQVTALRGGGDPLPESERAFFEPRMGMDLSQVRIHTDGAAVETSRQLQARAYTVGSDIAFNSGEFQPGTTAGRRLLGHELTHVAQQTGQVSAQREIGSQVQRQETPGDQGDAAVGGVAHIQEVLDNLKEGSFEDEEYTTDDLVQAWESLGRDGMLAVANNNYQLWQESVDYTFERLLYCPVYEEIEEKFRDDVLSTVQYYLDQNEAFIMEEMAKVGGEGGDLTPENLQYLCDLQMVARFYLDGLEALRNLNMAVVGIQYNDSWQQGDQPHTDIWTSPPPSGAEADQIKLQQVLSNCFVVRFQDIGPNSQLGANVDTSRTDLMPIMSYDQANSQYTTLFSLMSALAEAYPSIYVMLQAGTLDEFARVPINSEDHTVNPDGAQPLSVEDPGNDAKPELAQGIVIDALAETRKNITSTRGKLGDELTYRDFHLIQAQLLNGEAEAPGLTNWTSDRLLAHEVGQKVSDEEEGMSFWTALGLTLTAAGFALSVFATGGLALAGTALLAATVIPSGIQAAESVEHYQTLATARETNVSDSLAILTDQEVTAAKIQAAIDVACFAIDFIGVLGDIAHAAGASGRLIARLGGIEQVRSLITQSGGLDSFLSILQRAGGADEFIVLIDNLGDFNTVISTINALGPENFGALMTHCKGAEGFVALLREFDEGLPQLIDVMTRMSALGEGMDFVSILRRFSSPQQFMRIVRRFDGNYEDMARALVRFDSTPQFMNALRRFDQAADFCLMLERFNEVSDFVTTVNRLGRRVNQLIPMLDEITDMQLLLDGVVKAGSPNQFFQLLGRFDDRLGDFLTSLNRFPEFNDFEDTLNQFIDGGLTVDNYIEVLGRFDDPADFAATLARFSDGTSGTVNAELFLQTLNRFSGDTTLFVRTVEAFQSNVAQIGPALDSFGGNAGEMLEALNLLATSRFNIAGASDSTFGSFAIQMLPYLHNVDEARRILELAERLNRRGVTNITASLRQVIEATDTTASSLPVELQPLYSQWRNFDRTVADAAAAETSIRAIQGAYGNPWSTEVARLERYISANSTSVVAIGSLADTTTAAVGGAETLMIPNWSKALNFQYVQDGITNRNIFNLRTQLTDEALSNEEHYVSMYLRELELLQQAGYVRIGDYMVPPEIAQAAGYAAR